MLIEYFINVLLSIIPMIGTLGIISLVFYIGWVMALKKNPELKEQNKKFWEITKYLMLGLLGLTLFMSLTSQSHTYKHETHDRQELNAKIQEQIANDEVPEKKDLMLKPDLTKEQRAERFKELTNFR